jgi:hypothetical protein
MSKVTKEQMEAIVANDSHEYHAEKSAEDWYNQQSPKPDEPTRIKQERFGGKTVYHSHGTIAFACEDRGARNGIGLVNVSLTLGDQAFIVTFSDDEFDRLATQVEELVKYRTDIQREHSEYERLYEIWRQEYNTWKEKLKTIQAFAVRTWKRLKKQGKLKDPEEALNQADEILF